MRRLVWIMAFWLCGTAAAWADADKQEVVVPSPIVPLFIIPEEEIVDETEVPPAPQPVQEQAPGQTVPDPVAKEQSDSEETPVQEPEPAEQTDQSDVGSYVDPEFGLLPPSSEPETQSVANDASWKPSVEFGGEIRTRLGQDLAYEYSLIENRADFPPTTEGTEDVIDWRSSLRFWTRLKMSEYVQVFTEIYAEHSIVGKRNENDPTVVFNGRDYRHSLSLDIWEAYFDVFLGPFDLRAGNQIVSWGTMTVNGPSDRINPADTRALYWSDISGSRAPVLALRAVYHVWDFNFEAVWMPIFIDPPIDVYGGDFSLFRYDSAYGFTAYPLPDLGRYINSSKTTESAPELISTEKPDANPVNSQAGVRITGSKGGFDFGLSYLFAYESLPKTFFDAEVRALAGALLNNDNNLATAYVQNILNRLDSGETVDDLVRSEFERKHSIAAEFGTTLWEFGLKAELAFFPDKMYYTQDLLHVEHHTLAYAMGLDLLKQDLSVFSTLFINLELYGSAVFDVSQAEKFAFTTDRNLALFVNIRMAFLDDDLEFEATSQTSFSGQEFALIPKISYQPIQDLRLILGVMIVEAWAHEPKGFDRYSSNPDSKDTLLGQYSNNDQAFFTLKYSF